MVTIGDVFSVIALFLGIFLTSWALVVACGLLLPNHAERAARAAVDNPRRNVFVGLLLTVLILAIGIGFLSAPNPVLKGLGWAVLTWLMAVAAIGAAGLSLVVGRRIQDLDPGLAAFPSFIRAAAILLGGSMLPLLGWLAFGPLVLAASVGSGIKSLMVPRYAAQEA